MRRTFTALLTAALMAGTLGAAGQPAMAEPISVIHGLDAPDAIDGSYLVVYKSSAPQGLDLTRSAPSGASHTFRSAVRGFAATMNEQQARRLAAHPDVAFVEQNRRFRAIDPTYAEPSTATPQRSTTPRDVVTPNGPALPVPPMGRNVTAYVLDTGIRTTHTSLADPAPIWGTNTIGGPNSDCHGHGTHVAGIVGGKFSERWSAYNAQLVAVKVLDCVGYGTTASVVAGVDWVTANRTGPAIANMSLGSIASPAVDQAVQNSIASGITYIVAAGNNASDACAMSPARVPAAITVGATHGNGQRAWFSNYGSCLDIFSQGVSVVSAWHTSTTATSSLSGTSMAAPHIAALAAMYLSSNLTATPAQVRAGVMAGATRGQVIDPGPNSPNVMYTAWLAPFPSLPGMPRISCESFQSSIQCASTTSGMVTEFAWFSSGSYVGGPEWLFMGCNPGFNYPIHLIVSNSGGARSSNTVQITCTNLPPV
ncbi:S8 family peptidase [Micromonospora echinofusca]|uniref:S8 family peptidase n=1 Tax=Micromonospora echinofusca TaxID=47858 RepID=UPI0020225B45|nr:S8 family peptidase [Micromonospora sp. MSM11]MCL7456264.1 S8 family peptidase [Micromonospora sp. MSM11]